MQDGHPYRTEQLDRFRVMQRQQLREIPDKFIAPGKLLPDDIDVNDMPEGDRAYLELAIRDLVGQYAGELQELLAKVSPDTAYSRLRSFVATDVGEVPPNLKNARDDILERIKAQRPAGGTVGDEEAFRLAPVILLLVWADVLAGDYLDPRVEHHWGRGAPFAIAL